MMVGVLLAAVLLGGAIYLGIKVREDLSAGRLGLVALGFSSLVLQLIMLAVVGQFLFSGSGA